MNEAADHDPLKAVKRALQQGRKMDAIKLYRESSGRGLKESKEFVDRLAARLVEEDPVGYARLSRNSVCLSLVLLLLAITGVTIVRSVTS